MGLLGFGPFWGSSVTPLQVCQGWELRQGWHKAVLAPLSHSIPAKEEVPVTERAPGVTLSSVFPPPCRSTPAPTPPALPSKATLPFVPEFGEYKGGPLQSSPVTNLPLGYLAANPSASIPQMLCLPCQFAPLSLLRSLSSLSPFSPLGLKCQGCKIWAGGFRVCEV